MEPAASEAAGLLSDPPKHDAGPGRLAQLEERLVYTEKVGGSIPSSPTIPFTARASGCTLGKMHAFSEESTIGTTNCLNKAKGFGFISPEDGSNDAFVYISAVEVAGLLSLAEGQKVEFGLQPSRDGKFATQDLKVVE